MRTIEISDRVWQELQTRARPFVDKTPNDVLERELGGVKRADLRNDGKQEREGEHIDRRASGENLRSAYLDELKAKGKLLKPVAGGLFESTAGKLWKIQTATERRKGRWLVLCPSWAELRSRGG